MHKQWWCYASDDSRASLQPSTLHMRKAGALSAYAGSVCTFCVQPMCTCWVVCWQLLLSNSRSVWSCRHLLTVLAADPHNWRLCPYAHPGEQPLIIWSSHSYRTAHEPHTTCILQSTGTGASVQRAALDRLRCCVCHMHLMQQDSQ
jgi:hypothetical protein